MVINTEIKKSMREAFGKALEELGRKDVNVVALDADLSGSTQTKIFAKTFPDRFFNVGIAEQNLMTTAAGLAIAGKIPFAATFAMFATGRTYDQIRNSICYSKLNVKIIGSHGGVTVGEDGASHQALEDVALMRNIPNMTVIVPADAKEVEEAVKYAYNNNGPVYIRLSRANSPLIFGEDYVLENKVKTVVEGNDVVLFSNGETLLSCIQAAEILNQKGISAKVVNVPFVKPLDVNGVIKSAECAKLVITVENHSIIGGLGSAICEALSEFSPKPVIRFGVNDKFGQSGTPDVLLKHYELDPLSIARKVEVKYDSIKSGN